MRKWNEKDDMVIKPTIEEIETTQPGQRQPERNDLIDKSKIGAWIFYILGIVCLLFAQNFFFDDLDLNGADRCHFYEKIYVEGDALLYNILISATRSTAIMVRGLILAVCGCAFLIMGKLTAILGKLKNKAD